MIILKIKRKDQRTLNKLNQNNITKPLPQKAVDQLINYYNQGKISKVFDQAQSLVEKYPDAFFVWNILGVSAAQLGKLAYKKQSYRSL